LEPSIIVPATDRPATRERCLDAIRRAMGPADELWVIEDPLRVSPAAARNDGAGRSGKAVLVFVDTDVAVHPDALDRLRLRFAADPQLDALFGSYDDVPTEPGTVSQFRNLLHHHVYQAAGGDASTFWAGLGAVRRDASRPAAASMLVAIRAR